jgi:hypothetical protein
MNKPETQPGGSLEPVGSADRVRLNNDTKIRFCNAMHVLTQHTYVCTECTLYTERGDGDLCDRGKGIIARELAWANTGIEFPPNVPAQRPPATDV